MHKTPTSFKNHQNNSKYCEDLTLHDPSPSEGKHIPWIFWQLWYNGEQSGLVRSVVTDKWDNLHRVLHTFDLMLHESFPQKITISWTPHCGAMVRKLLFLDQLRLSSAFDPYSMLHILGLVSQATLRWALIISMWCND